MTTLYSFEIQATEPELRILRGELHNRLMALNDARKMYVGNKELTTQLSNRMTVLLRIVNQLDSQK